MAKKKGKRRDASAQKPKALRKQLRKAEAELAKAVSKRDKAQARVDALGIIADEIRAQLADIDKAATKAAQADAKSKADTAKPPAAKPPARKPAAKKPAAKKPAAAKPAAAKPTAKKPAAKPTAKKPAAKPTAKKPAAKPTAKKPATKKPAAANA